MNTLDPVPLSLFRESFEVLTGKAAFPWQEELFVRFARGVVPKGCDLPTGIGKTSVIAIWLIALARLHTKIPRRLVYIVNRRTVVDQTTYEVEKLRENLAAAGLVESLGKLATMPAESPLAISTLRGQFADNREWSADPCRPAVIVGTVDMMGSRLLFGGYGIGFKTRPLHAGFLGQDTLIIHDEAHLEPAFQDLLTAIAAEQRQCNERNPCSETRKVHVMELSATPRSEGEPFRLTSADEEHPVVKARLGAVKMLWLHPVEDTMKVQARLIELARRHKDSGRAVVVFATGVKDVEQIATALEKEVGKENVERLTGTMRGKERDELVEKPVFRRILPPDESTLATQPATEGTVYLVCTSAGEVGINISAAHLVCDLSSFDSMAQRFGRVNRFGEHADSEVDVVHPTEFDQKSEREQRREKTLALLQRLNGSANSNAIRDIPAEERRAGFAPEPTILPVSDILFDVWSFTTITGSFPGRPALAPYLHGVSENEPPETRVAWREEVGHLKNEELRVLYPPDELLADYPLKPHEILRDRSDRVWDALSKLVSSDDSKAFLPAWLLDEDGAVKSTTLGALAEKRAKEALFNVTLLLPPTAGGLAGGMLDSTSATANDVADEWHDEHGQPRRLRLWSDDEERDAKTQGMRLVREVNLHPGADETEEDADTGYSRWLWFELPRSADTEGSRSARKEILLDDHTRNVESLARRFAEKFGLDAELIEAVALAARFHDSGKRRHIWQRSVGNFDLHRVLAKSGRKSVPPQLRTDYRHEFGSALDLESAQQFQQLSPEMKDVVLHLVAAHHGRARPHFPAKEIFDPRRSQESAVAFADEAPRRFARLQRKYGRWHLAWLESLLRAADYAASANPTTITAGGQAVSAPNIRIQVDPTNPGQFFACCGLLELAGRISADAEGCFVGNEFVIENAGNLPALIRAITCAELRQLDAEDATSTRIQIETPFNLRLDWWKDDVPALAALKVWAGTMESFRIARAMQHAMRADIFSTANLLDAGVVAYDPDDLEKKVEPFYFDARRGPNAHSRDVGFSPNDLSMTTTAFPAVEFLCLVGFQRCRPVPIPPTRSRIYDYFLWSQPLAPMLLPTAVAGLLGRSRGYRFESWFRTGQKKHKAFITAKSID